MGWFDNIQYEGYDRNQLNQIRNAKNRIDSPNDRTYQDGIILGNGPNHSTRTKLEEKTIEKNESRPNLIVGTHQKKEKYDAFVFTIENHTYAISAKSGKMLYAITPEDGYRTNYRNESDRPYLDKAYEDITKRGKDNLTTGRGGFPR